MEIDINKLIASKPVQESLKVVEKLKSEVAKFYKNKPHHTVPKHFEVDWAIDRASEYNPKNFKEGLMFTLQLLELKLHGKYYGKSVV